MEYAKVSCEEFVERLSTKQPIPGGGGAAAIVAAIGTALGNMVGSLTVGKKKYQAVESVMLALKSEADKLQKKFLLLADEDAKAFLPLSKAYGLPKTTQIEIEHRNKVMEEALQVACEVPLLILEACGESILLVRDFAKLGSAIAISDAGCAAACLKAAMEAAVLNVRINTKSMKDRAYAQRCDEKAQSLTDQFIPIAEETYREVLSRLV
jgi:formiminotetrahydrofolate cyclodeaminase